LDAAGINTESTIYKRLRESMNEQWVEKYAEVEASPPMQDVTPVYEQLWRGRQCAFQFVRQGSSLWAEAVSKIACYRNYKQLGWSTTIGEKRCIVQNLMRYFIC